MPSVDGAITRCAEHRRGRTGAQHVGVIDVRSAGDHRVHQRQHLAARTGATDPADQPHRRVDQRLQPEPLRQRRDEQQPGVGDQVRVVEGRPRCGRSRAILASLEVPPGLVDNDDVETPSLSQLRRPFSWIREPPHTRPIGGSRLNHRACQAARRAATTRCRAAHDDRHRSRRGAGSGAGDLRARRNRGLGRRRVHQQGQPWRRPSRRCMSLLAGGVSVTPASSGLSTTPVRTPTADSAQPSIPPGYCSGWWKSKTKLSNRLLREVGVDPAAVRRALLTRADHFPRYPARTDQGSTPGAAPARGAITGQVASHRADPGRHGPDYRRPYRLARRCRSAGAPIGRPWSERMAGRHAEWGGRDAGGDEPSIGRGPGSLTTVTAPRHHVVDRHGQFAASVSPVPGAAEPVRSPGAPSTMLSIHESRRRAMHKRAVATVVGLSGAAMLLGVTSAEAAPKNGLTFEVTCPVRGLHDRHASWQRRVHAGVRAGPSLHSIPRQGTVTVDGAVVEEFHDVKRAPVPARRSRAPLKRCSKTVARKFRLPAPRSVVPRGPTG